MNFNINISGSGTREEITSALRYLIQSIEDVPVEILEGGVEWEDEILSITIEENEDLLPITE